MRLTRPGARKSLCMSVWGRDVHHDAPHTILLLPDPNVAALLAHCLRVVRHFVSSVRVTKIAGARNIAGDRLPLDRDLSVRQRLSRSLNADVWKMSLR